MTIKKRAIPLKTTQQTVDDYEPLESWSNCKFEWLKLANRKDKIECLSLKGLSSLV